jgi:hypothetical protein
MLLKTRMFVRNNPLLARRTGTDIALLLADKLRAKVLSDRDLLLRIDARFDQLNVQQSERSDLHVYDVDLHLAILRAISASRKLVGKSVKSASSADHPS